MHSLYNQHVTNQELLLLIELETIFIPMLNSNPVNCIESYREEEAAGNHSIPFDGIQASRIVEMVKQQMQTNPDRWEFLTLLRRKKKKFVTNEEADAIINFEFTRVLQYLKSDEGHNGFDVTQFRNQVFNRVTSAGFNQSNVDWSLDKALDLKIAISIAKDEIEVEPHVVTHLPFFHLKKTAEEKEIEQRTNELLTYLQQLILEVLKAAQWPLGVEYISSQIVLPVKDGEHPVIVNAFTTNKLEAIKKILIELTDDRSVVCRHTHEGTVYFLTERKDEFTPGASKVPYGAGAVVSAVIEVFREDGSGMTIHDIKVSVMKRVVSGSVSEQEMHTVVEAAVNTLLDLDFVSVDRTTVKSIFTSTAKFQSSFPAL